MVAPTEKVRRVPMGSVGAAEERAPWSEGFNILMRTKEFRGDHEAEIAIAVRPKAGETIEELIARVAAHPMDVIEIRVLVDLPAKLPAKRA